MNEVAKNAEAATLDPKVADLLELHKRATAIRDPRDRTKRRLMNTVMDTLLTFDAAQQGQYMNALAKLIDPRFSWTK